jgi:hypothetical protein
VDNARGQTIANRGSAFGYIERVTIREGIRVRSSWAALATALVFAAAGFAGCGSSGDGGESGSTRAEAPSTSAPASSPAEPRQPGSDESRPHRDSTKQGKSPAEKAQPAGADSAGDGHTRQGGGGEEGRHRSRSPDSSQPDAAVGAETGTSRVAKSNSGRCPSGVSREECKAIAAHSTEGAPSHVVSTPQECVAAYGREQCERLLEHQASGAGSESIDVGACLRNPTPRCEAALVPILEAEKAAAAR